jgi:rubrerythrin
VVRDYLNDCQKIEKVLGEVYRKLAGVEIYSEKLRSIFERMARDEDDHARQLEQAKGIPEESFAKDRRFDERKLEELLRQAHQLLRMAANPAPSERLMLETAKDLEMEFIKIHLQNAVRFRDAAMAELFRKMAREDQEHFETLDSYYKDS